MRFAWLPLIALCAATAARADEPTRLVAHFTRADPATVTDGQGFALPRGAGFAQVAIARRAVTADVAIGAAVLLRCDARVCDGTPLRLPAAERIEVLGVIDLDGAAVTLPTDAARADRAERWTPIALLGGARRARWPALALRTTWTEVGTGATRDGGEVRGTAITTRLVIVSLRRRDHGRVLFDDALQDTGVTGAGVIRTFTLIRASARGRLAIAATEQRRGDRTSACLPPPPISYAYRWDGDRYQRDDGPLAGAPCH